MNATATRTATSYIVQTVVIREVQCLVRVPRCPELIELLGLEGITELREKMANIPDYRQVVARLKLRVHQWESSVVSVQFTAIKADGTVGGFSMDRDGNVTTVWVYVRF